MMDITAAELKLLRKYASGEMLEWDDSEVSALRAAIRVILRVHEGFPREGARGDDGPVTTFEDARLTLCAQCGREFKLVVSEGSVP